MKKIYYIIYTTFLLTINTLIITTNGTNPFAIIAIILATILIATTILEEITNETQTQIHT